jgi:hypothetical protein
MRWPVVSDDLDVQAHYEHCRDEGTTHSLAEMFALQSPPMSDSDREFLEGRGGCYAQFANDHSQDDRYGRMVAAKAKAAGVSIQGKIFQSGLARFSGDPEAWVSGKSDVKALCEKRGWGCKGAVKVEMADVEGPPAIDIAADIVDRVVGQEVAKNPEAGRGRNRLDLREKVKNRLKGKA